MRIYNEEFDFFLSEIVRLSMSSQAVDLDYEYVLSYIHLIKMLDAVELIRERGVQKIRKKNRIAAITE